MNRKNVIIQQKFLRNLTNIFENYRIYQYLSAKLDNLANLGNLEQIVNIANLVNFANSTKQAKIDNSTKFVDLNNF